MHRRDPQVWAGKLKQPMDNPVNVVGETAVLRATLWQYLREQADAGQRSPERLTRPRLAHAALTHSAHTDSGPSAVAPFP